MQNALIEEEEPLEEVVLDEEGEPYVVPAEDSDYSEDDMNEEQNAIEHVIGPRGEMYASSSDGEEEFTDEDGFVRPRHFYIPRVKMHAYK
jgi:hypothetical protein